MNNCILCRSSKLSRIYQADKDNRGLSVYICEYCGMVQSFPRIDYISNHTPSLSSGADFGNIRYGKHFSLSNMMCVIEKFKSVFYGHNFLDVGAGNGEVANSICDIANFKMVWAIEPDESLVHPKNFFHGELDRYWITRRVEDVNLPESYFSLVIMNHTLEHIKEPINVLNKIFHSIREEGIIYIEVPNLSYLMQASIVEEYFISKHINFFDINTLLKTMTTAGFEIVEFIPTSTCENIWVVGSRARMAPKVHLDSIKNMIDKYLEGRHKLNRLIRDNVVAINGDVQSGKRVAFWGAGRIFDCYVREGLNWRGLCGIIDLYLPQDKSPYPLIQDVNQVPECDCIVISSREYENEIRGIIQSSEIRTKVLSWKDVL